MRRCVVSCDIIIKYKRVSLREVSRRSVGVFLCLETNYI
jgi:hypothetical protein